MQLRILVLVLAILHGSVIALRSTMYRFKSGVSASHKRLYGNNRIPLVLEGRKIDEEDAILNSSSKKKGNKKRKGKSASKKAAPTEKVESDTLTVEPKMLSAPMLEEHSSSDIETVEETSVIEQSMPVITTTETETTVGTSTKEVEEEPSITSVSDKLASVAPIMEMSDGDYEDVDTIDKGGSMTPFNSELETMDFPLPQVSKGMGNMIAPEEVFFGDPRKPPPIAAYKDTKYHGSLLYWTRHGTVAPRTSEDRLDRVYPYDSQSSLLENSMKVSIDNLNYQGILREFEAVAEDLEKSKRFIVANLDTIPSKLFLRALTAQKLSVQSKGDVIRAKSLSNLRDRYILAHDQVFFPLNIEIQKAETRVMTYVSRQEFFNQARNWDAIEMSCFLSTLLAARLTWDDRVKTVMKNINARIANTVEYMSRGIKEDLMIREFRKPGLTAEIYLNASIELQNNQELYNLVIPELKAVHETYFFLYDNKLAEAKQYIQNQFCTRENISMGDLVQRLACFESSLAGVQGIDYIELRLMTSTLLEALERDAQDGIMKSRIQWYSEHMNSAEADFQTYEAVNVPVMLKSEQRMRDTGNAFSNFMVQVMKGPTKYSQALSGSRPKGDDPNIQNWLYNDEGWNTVNPASMEERMEMFTEAYQKQTQARKEEQSIEIFASSKSAKTESKG